MKITRIIPILLLLLFPSTVFAADVKFQTKKEAAEYIREQMIDRSDSVSFLIKSSEMHSAATDMNDIMDLAYTYDPVLKGSGDYLELVSKWKLISPDSIHEEGYVAKKLRIVYFTDKEQEALIQRGIKDTLKSLNLTGKTDLVKIQTIYNYIIKNVKYTNKNRVGEKDLYDTPYTVLNYKALNLNTPQCRCEGFAGLLYRMLKESGINCRILQGEIPVSIKERDGHSWNIIKYNGYWYSCDATRDRLYHKIPRYFMVPGKSCNNASYSSFAAYTRDDSYTGNFYKRFPMAINPVLDPGLSVKTTSKKIACRTLKKKPFSFRAFNPCKTAVTYKLLNPKTNKSIKINKSTGKITVKKGTKKGTYHLKIKAISKKIYGYKKICLQKNIKIKVY